jgi:hypothetical protein
MMIRIVGHTVSRVSPTNHGDVIDRLTEWAHPQEQWQDQRRTIQEIINFLMDGAAMIENEERRKYDAAIVEAGLPDRVSGEVYLRAWPRIYKYDSQRGTLPGWLWGFVPKIYKEQQRFPSDWQYMENDSAEIEDHRSLDPTAGVLGLTDGEFEAIFGQISKEHLAGIDWTKQAEEDLRLVDIWRKALFIEWSALTMRHRAVLADAICNNVDRTSVARMYDFRERNGVDQLWSRFTGRVQRLAARLRAEHIWPRKNR